MAEKKKMSLAEILEAIESLRAQLAEEIPKLQKERAELQKVIDEAKREFEEKTAKARARIAEIDKILAAAGVKGVRIRRAPAAPRGGLRAAAAQWINSLGVGAEFRAKDFKEATGITSGYGGVILSSWVEAGYLSKPAAGLYRVEKLIPVE